MAKSKKVELINNGKMDFIVVEGERIGVIGFKDETDKQAGLQIIQNIVDDNPGLHGPNLYMTIINQCTTTAACRESNVDENSLEEIILEVPVEYDGDSFTEKINCLFDEENLTVYYKDLKAEKALVKVASLRGVTYYGDHNEVIRDLMGMAKQEIANKIIDNLKTQERLASYLEDIFFNENNIIIETDINKEYYLFIKGLDECGGIAESPEEIKTVLAEVISKKDRSSVNITLFGVCLTNTLEEVVIQASEAIAGLEPQEDITNKLRVF